MPFSAPGSIKAKDADLANQSIATAQGDGLAATPYVPLHADIGIGDPSDPIAPSPSSTGTVISFIKALLNELWLANTKINDIFVALGALWDLPAIDGLGNSSAISLLKAILQRSPKVAFPANNYLSTTNNQIIFVNSCLLGAIDVVNTSNEIKYIRLYDSNSSTSGTPFRIFPIYANGGLLTIDRSHWGSQLSGEGKALVNGLGFAISTHPTVLNLAPIGDCIVQIDVYII